LVQDADNTSPFKQEIDWDPDPTKVNYSKLFFDYFAPSVVGKAAVLDEFLRRESTNPDVPNPHKARVELKNIRFHRPEHSDPDFLVRSCIDFNSFLTTCVLF
jgi:hypothetical protein